MSDSWTTQSGPTVSASLEKRARKRTVEQVHNFRWSVLGDPKLGDSFPEYMVRLPDNSTKLTCDCTSHYGGQYRKFCSHALAVIYYRQDNPDLTYDDPAPQSTDPGGLGVGSDSTEIPTSVPVPSQPPPVAMTTTPMPVSIAGQIPQDLPSWGDEPQIPDEFSEFRSHQIPAIEEVVNLFNSGYKVVILDAPTGSGKTFAAEAVRRLMMKSAIYTCTTKTLQDQVTRDYPYVKVLKGRANYPTLDNPKLTSDLCVKGPAKLPACPKCPGWDKGASWDSQPDAWDDESDQSMNDDIVLHCHFCHPVHRCAYEIAKGEALRASVAVVNTPYLLTEANGPGRFSKQDLIILDEADTLEQQLMSYIEVGYTAAKRKALFVGEPKFVTKEDSWVDWINDKVVDAIEGDIYDTRRQIKSLGPVPKLIKKLKSSENLLTKTKWLVRPTEEGDPNLTGWVMNNGQGTLAFKPVRVADYAQELLWRHSKRFLVMSATVVSPEQMAADLGMEEGEWAVVSVPSTFPVQRRPIVLDTVGKLNRETKVQSYPAAADRVVEIAKRHPDERILVHTVSYELNKIIYNRMRKSPQGDRVETYFNASEREAALDRYLLNPNAIMLSPSFERGVDLAGDDCRIIVVAKVPFPYLGDKQIKARTYGTHDGRMWYAVQTIRAICQMTGRAMRSKNDWAISYILDSSFQDLYGPNRKLFPEWWSDAIVWDENDPKWRDSVLKVD